MANAVDTLGGAEKRAGGMRTCYDSDEYFKMGAAVAVGELYSMGELGDQLRGAARVRDYLGSFGIRSLDDIDDLGIRGPYRRDFEKLYGAVRKLGLE